MLHAELDVDAAAGRLRLRRTGGCHGCSAAAGCGAAAIAGAAKPVSVPLPEGWAHVADGQTVLAEFEPAALFRLCVLMFLPLSLLMVGGAWLAVAVSSGSADGAALVGAVAGLTVGCAWLNRYDSRFGSRWLRHRRWVLPSGKDAVRAS